MLETGEIWASKIKDTNDKDEISFHSDMSNKVYIACFCNTKSEQIPMWFLYSGMDRGYSYGFTPKFMYDTISDIKVKGLVDENKREYQDLEIGKDIDFEFGFIYYKTLIKGRYKYRGSFYKLNGDEKSFENNNYFIKKYPWEYEKEFRLVFINKTDIDFDKIVIVLKKDYKKYIKIKVSPNNNYDEIMNYCENILKGISKNNIFSSSINLSIDLMKKNRNQILKYVSELKDKGNDNDKEYLKDLLKVITKKKK